MSNEGKRDVAPLPFVPNDEAVLSGLERGPFRMSRKALAKYHRLEKIGEGTYGVVYRAEHVLTHTPMALKIIRLDSVEEGSPSTAVREVSLLKQLVHPNIVTLHEVIHSSSSLILVFEYLNQDLKNLLDAVGPVPLDPYMVQSYLYQLLQAIAFCHKNHTLHRDIKPQNLLLGANGVLKLADFGLARGISIPIAKLTNEVITLWYRPPDILMGATKYSFAVDVWGIGCIFAEMALGRPLFCGSSDVDQLGRIFSVTGSPTEQSWPELSTFPNVPTRLPTYPGVPLSELIPSLGPAGCDLLRSMLVLNPKHRISAHEALQHPYFADLREAAQAQEILRSAGLPDSIAAAGGGGGGGAAAGGGGGVSGVGSVPSPLSPATSTTSASVATTTSFAKPVATLADVP